MPPREHHRSQRSNWLRAGVLGANDGVVSTASLMVGVASASDDPHAVLVAGIAGLAAGALSMAAGEYVSVSTQRDAELADVRMEVQSHREHPREELEEMATMYEERGLSPELAREVAEQFHAQDAVRAHLREELNLDPHELAKPGQAAFASAVSFAVGASVPILVSLVGFTWLIVVSAAICLAGTGALGAQLGGAPVGRAVVRVVLGGLAAMGLTAALGSVVGLAM